MLREISIRDFAIIEQIHLTFDRGFHVLTGETGAGKSILFDALSLVVGGRASADFVRHNARKATVEALFEVPVHHAANKVLRDIGLNMEDHSLLIRREISSSGKSTCRINGQIVTLGMLKQVGKHLLDMHGQHEHQKLLQTEEHIAWLDAFGGESLHQLLEDYQALYRKYREVTRELEEIQTNEKEIAQRIDWLTFQRDEIKEACLIPGEDKELEQEQSRLAHAEHLMQNATYAYEGLYGEQQGVEILNRVIQHLEDIVNVDPSMKNVLEMVQSAYYHIEEASREIGRYRDTLDFDPGRLAQVEERLHLIEQLKRKYGESVSEIFQYAEQAEEELNQLEQQDEKKAELEEKRTVLHERMRKQALLLNQTRKEAAVKLEQLVEKELADLNMQGTRFSVAFHQVENPEFTLTGVDQVEFMISPNVGEPLRPLVKIASGGELSRIMLAIQSIFSGLNGASDTLIFDEVDTGVSGRAAQAIAEKITRLARHCQVLCVTHLPQVACMADEHFHIFKEAIDGKTRTRVKLLTEEGRILELARMLGGVEVTDTTRNHALEMIRLAKETKQVM